MSFHRLLAVFAAVHTVGGLACVVAPAAMIASFGVTLPAMGLVVYQFWGASMAGVGALSWLLRGTTDPGILKPLLLVLIGLNFLNAVLAVRGQFAGASKSGWMVVLLYSLFVLAFLAFAFRSMRQEPDRL